MIKILKSADRGPTKFDWLDSWHTFSFGRYYNPAYRGFGPLRVINEDIVAPGGGFAPHGHDNMEIVTYILSGSLAHKDSMGNGSVIRPGDIQRMSAGTGVTHSEYNASDSEPVHLLQIWFLPEKRDIQPGYQEKSFGPDDKNGRLKLLVSRSGKDDAVSIHQDVDMYAANLNQDDKVIHTLAQGRIAWVQVAKGSLKLNGEPLRQGDGAAITAENSLSFTDAEKAEIILFDMAA